MNKKCKYYKEIHRDPYIMSTCEYNNGELCDCFGNINKCDKPTVLEGNVIRSVLLELIAYINRPQNAHRVCIPVELAQRIVKELQENENISNT